MQKPTRARRDTQRSPGAARPLAHNVALGPKRTERVIRGQSPYIRVSTGCLGLAPAAPTDGGVLPETALRHAPRFLMQPCGCGSAVRGKRVRKRPSAPPVVLATLAVQCNVGGARKPRAWSRKRPASSRALYKLTAKDNLR